MTSCGSLLTGVGLGVGVGVGVGVGNGVGLGVAVGALVGVAVTVGVGVGVTVGSGAGVDGLTLLLDDGTRLVDGLTVDSPPQLADESVARLMAAANAAACNDDW